MIALYLFVPILWFAAGICLFAAVQFLISGAYRRQEHVFLSFGLLALLVSIYMMLATGWYKATSVEQAQTIAVYQMTVVCVTYPVFIWFIGAYTGVRSYRFLILIAACFGLLLVVNLFSPRSFLYSDISIGESLVLPWGEQVNHFDVKLNRLAWLYYVCTYTVFAWAIWRLVRSYREKSPWPPWPLLIYLLVQFGAVVHAQLIDILGLNSIYLGEFAFLILIVLMSITLGSELRRRSIALERSVTELKEQTGGRLEAEKKLVHMAYHDFLTGLANRASLEGRLAEAVRNARHDTFFAALLIDLDHFKIINDALGHDVGDEVLCQVAKQLSNSSGERETVVRFGGDEFVVLIESLPSNKETAMQQARAVAERILNGIVQPFRVGAHELSVGASIGVTLFSSDEA